MKYAFGRWWELSNHENGTGYMEVHSAGQLAGIFYRNGLFKSHPVYSQIFLPNGTHAYTDPLKKFDGRKFPTPLECLKTINEV